MAFRRQGYPVAAYYLAEDMQAGYPGEGDVTIHLHAPGLKPIEEPVLIDLLCGRAYAIENAKRDESGPASFSKPPLTDYPLLVTDRRAFRLKWYYVPNRRSNQGTVQLQAWQ